MHHSAASKKQSGSVPVSTRSHKSSNAANRHNTQPASLNPGSLLHSSLLSCLLSDTNASCHASPGETTLRWMEYLLEEWYCRSIKPDWRELRLASKVAGCLGRDGLALVGVIEAVGGGLERLQLAPDGVVRTLDAERQAGCAALAELQLVAGHEARRNARAQAAAVQPGALRGAQLLDPAVTAVHEHARMPL